MLHQSLKNSMQILTFGEDLISTGLPVGGPDALSVFDAEKSYCPARGVALSIDGAPVMDVNNAPVTTDSAGYATGNSDWGPYHFGWKQGHTLLQTVLRLSQL